MKRRWILKRAAFGAAASLAVIAAAFFFATYVSDGVTPDRETGTGGGNFAQPISMDLGEGLTPTNRVEVSAAVDNTTGQEIQWQSFILTPETPAVPECAGWLDFYAEYPDETSSPIWTAVAAGTNGLPLEPIPPGEHNIFDYTPNGLEPVTMYLRFDPAIAESTNQEACESTTVRVSGELTMPPSE